MTRIPDREKWTASHWVKLLTAALAPLYAGILVKGVYAFMEEMLMIITRERRSEVDLTEVRNSFFVLRYQTAVVFVRSFNIST
ncbi:hypothetical protein C8P63_11687 [Melghirimyces profundicolus]|uniref:Uncharacterized protein n=1 Tax=Melghirimyces profundicolus TaxID=1242148 RepID=A0A2T6BQY0_9BACL|nr:hypothetical protein C8P63_11687 [Melghirimyces profundicolus]